MEKNNYSMSDYSLIENHRELTKMLSELEVHTTNCEQNMHSVRFSKGEINDDFLGSLVGKTLELDSIESVSTFISTDPLRPLGICQSVDGGLLVTFRDIKSDAYKLEPHRKRLARHVTMTGDVIHEYEY
ncbi:uncharacterized protein LOC134255470 [Saccostrea cucullata]|uniref:uncharacterized protein LOC134255470 n=1 Tax=Saccostrea cuccullata TaxID=36930 RepID=UPI002ED5D832